MRYLDREPRVGDRVHVEFEGVVRKSPGDTTVYVTHNAASWWVNVSEARVIAPEPAVGDVVTEDMDLPEGSIIERGAASDPARHRLALRVRDTCRALCWDSDHSWYSTRDLPTLPPYSDPWRIVRIGGAS